jgi:DNA-binding transcriptional LysR family regulator
MQDLNSTMFFVKVVVAGSFTKAASLLGVPKSTVSDKVAQLERELGVTLLTRTTRKLKLTDVGEEFFRKAEEGVSQLQSAGEEAAQAQKAPMGTLRLTGPAEMIFFGSVLEAITEYRTKFPLVKIEFEFIDRMVDLVAEGYDIAIRAGDLADSGLMARKIGLSNMILVASPGYVKKAPPLTNPKDLSEHRCLRFLDPPSDDIWTLRSKQGKSARVQIPISLSGNSFTALKALAVADQGILLAPNTLCQAEIADKRLVRVLPDWSTVDVPIHLVYSSQRFSSPKVKEMLPLLEKGLQKLVFPREPRK